MNFFDYTTLPRLCSEFDENESALVGVTSNNTETDLMMWLNKDTKTMGKNIQRSYEVYTTLYKYLCGKKNVGDLVDKDNLEKMGISPTLLQPFFLPTKSKQQNEDSLFFSLYLNAFGCARASDLIDSVMMFHCEDEKKQENIPQKKIDKDLLQCTLTKKDADAIANAIFTNHLSDPNIRSVRSMSFEKTREDIAKIVCAKTLNMEILLGEILRECILPFEYERLFVKESASFSRVQYTVKETELNLMSRPFNVKAHLNEMRTNFLELVLPQRFQLSGMDCTPALDVLLNTVLGCELDLVKVVSDIISFSWYLEYGNTDQILEQIKYNEKAVSGVQNNASHANMMKKEWLKVACFVLWFRMYTVILGHGNLSISNTDNFTKMQPNVIYYYKGNYYLSYSKFNIVGSSYRCVLHHYGIHHTNSHWQRLS